MVAKKRKFYLFNFLIYFGILVGSMVLGQAIALEFLPGSTQELVFADEGARKGMSYSSYNPYQNCGAGGCSPEDMRTEAKLGGSSGSSNPFTGANLDDLNYKHVFGRDEKYYGSDLQVELPNLDEDKYSRLASMLKLRFPANSSVSEKKEAIELGLTAILVGSLDKDYFEPLFVTPFSERGFEILADGSSKKAQHLMDSYLTLKPLSREMLGPLGDYSWDDLDDPQEKEEMIDLVQEAYFKRFDEHLDRDQALDKLYEILAQIMSIKNAGAWEGLCYEAAAWNSNPAHGALLEEFHQTNGNILLCDSPIGIYEVENLIPFLYDEFKVDEAGALGVSHYYQNPYTSKSFNEDLKPEDLRLPPGKPTTQTLEHRQRGMSTFLYQNYYDRYGVHPSGMDFCQFDERLEAHVSGESDRPYPIIDDGDGNERWNFVALDSTRRVSSGVGLIEVAKEFRGKKKVESLNKEQLETLKLLAKHAEALCGDLDFLKVVGKNGAEICQKIKNNSPKPLYMVEVGLDGFYECEEMTPECLGASTSECQEIKRVCDLNFKQRCDNKCGSSPLCNYGFQQDSFLCYQNNPKSQREAEYFAKTFLMRANFLEQEVLNLMNHIKQDLGEREKALLGDYKIVGVSHQTKLLNNGDYYSRPDQPLKMKVQSYSGDVLLKNNQSLSCAWKGIWGEGVGSKSYKTRVPQRVYHLEIPSCQEEDNYAIDLLKKVKNCPTLKDLADQFTKLVLDLSLGNSQSERALEEFDQWAFQHDLRGVEIEELVARASAMID